MKASIVFILGLLFALRCAGITCQQTVRGQVVDVEGVPVEYANVVLLTEDSVFVAGCVTDEGGLFCMSDLPAQGWCISISAIGYETLTSIVPPDGNMGVLTLASAVVQLDEVVVSKQRPQHRISRGGLVTTVQGSVLEILGNAVDVIEQLPGVRREDEQISVFGKGTPDVYVDGRRLTDNSELYRLSSKDIASVEVLHSPGAKYGSEVKSVILVRTVRKRGDGWSGSVQAVGRMAHAFSQSDNLNLNYRKKGLDVFGSFAFDYAKRYQKQRNNTLIVTDEERYDLDAGITILPMSISYVANAGLNWQIDAKNVLGVKYEFQGTPRNPSDWSSKEQVVCNGEAVDEIDYQTHWERKNMPLHTANMYYIGDWGNWTFTLNNDYYTSRNRSQQDIDEFSLSEGSSSVSSLNRIRSRLFASKGVLEYAWDKYVIEGGYEYTHTRRVDRYYNYTDFLPDADDDIREQTVAAFVNATVPFGKLELSAGIRYEHTASDYYQDGAWVAEQSRKYDRLFPNVDFTFPAGRARFTLSYSAKTRRPLYSQLSSNIQYDDRFTYETGNPLLQPEMNHDVTLAGIYKWIFMSASYQYVTDAIVGIVEPYEAGEPINLMTYRNYDHLSKYTAVLSFSPKFGRWSPRLRLNLMGQRFTLTALGEARHMNNPLLFVNFYNSVSLGKGFTATGDVTCHTAGDMDVVTLKPSWQINLGITKTLGNWYFQLNATDLFKTARNSMITYGTQMKLDKWNYSDSQAVRLTVRYSFNTTMSKYKGRSAGQSEKNRL